MLLDADIIHQIEGTLKWDAMKARGSIDGAGIVPEDHLREEWRGKDFGFELKGVSGFQFKKYDGNDAKEEHLNQVHRYFLMSGFDLFVILYEDKSTQDLLEWVIEPDKNRLAEQLEELTILNDHIDNKTLPEIKPACSAGMGDEFKYCPFGTKRGACLKIDTYEDMREIIND